MENNFRPKLGKINTPTPFHELKNLRNELKVKPRIFIKRDDLTEIGLGGNKNRKLDYIMYDALEKGADTIITWGGLQSNHCRQTLAFANILNMDCHLVLNGEPQVEDQGNLFIYNIYGAKIYYELDKGKCLKRCEDLKVELEEKGKKPYLIPLGASIPLGSLGYIESAKEIAEQAKIQDINIQHIFLATGSAGTQAGLEVGAKLYLPNCKIHGISISHSKEELQNKVSKLANEVARYIDKKMKFEVGDICIKDDYIGIGYAIPTKEGNDSIRILGSTEGILLDPVYTGKAMSGMIDILNKGDLDDSEAIVFVHTGGGPSIFNFTKSFY